MIIKMVGSKLDTVIGILYVTEPIHYWHTLANWILLLWFDKIFHMTKFFESFLIEKICWNNQGLIEISHVNACKNV